MSEAGAISRTRSPLSRSAGEGPGVRASRSAGEEGGIIPPDLLPSPPSAHPQGEKGGMSEAGAISRTRSPLSRSAGEGPGVRASRSAGEEGGIIPPDLPPSPPSAHPQGEKGGMSEAGAISRTRSPLSRSAGEGLGVRASRSAGEGLGVRASRSAGEEGGIIPPDLPPSPPSAHPQGEKGGMSEAGAISRTKSPLSRSAGERLGVRASRSAGEEGGIIPPDLPPSPPSAHPQGEKGGMSEAGAISRTRSPLSRSAGEGPGVRGRTVRSQQEIRVVDHPLR